MTSKRYPSHPSLGGWRLCEFARMAISNPQPIRVPTGIPLDDYQIRLISQYQRHGRRGLALCQLPGKFLPVGERYVTIGRECKAMRQQVASLCYNKGSTCSSKSNLQKDTTKTISLSISQASKFPRTICHC